MARPQLHGFRDGETLDVKGTALRVDTRRSDDWVLLVRVSDGVPVVRAAKQDSGRRFRQGTNPDYKGFLAYRVYYRPGFADGSQSPVDAGTPWSEYTDSAEAGSVRWWLGDRIT